MRRIYIAMCCLWAGISGVCAQDNTNKVRITLRQAIQIASQFNLNENASEVITGIILFFLIGCEFFINYKVEFRKNRKEAK